MTRTLTWFPRNLVPTKMRCPGEYLIAFEMRFCTTFVRRAGSAITQCFVGDIFKIQPARSAALIFNSTIWCSNAFKSSGTRETRICPSSNVEKLSRDRNNSLIDVTDCSIFRTLSRADFGKSSWCSPLVSMPMAWSGWRRSWLAWARNRDLLVFALSALSRSKANSWFDTLRASICRSRSAARSWFAPRKPLMR